MCYSDALGLFSASHRVVLMYDMFSLIEHIIIVIVCVYGLLASLDQSSTVP